MHGGVGAARAIGRRSNGSSIYLQHGLLPSTATWSTCKHAPRQLVWVGRLEEAGRHLHQPLGVDFANLVGGQPHRGRSECSIVQHVFQPVLGNDSWSTCAAPGSAATISSEKCAPLRPMGLQAHLTGLLLTCLEYHWQHQALPPRPLYSLRQLFSCVNSKHQLAHLPHVLLCGQHQLVVHHPLRLVLEDGAGGVDEHGLALHHCRQAGRAGNAGKQRRQPGGGWLQLQRRMPVPSRSSCTHPSCSPPAGACINIPSCLLTYSPTSTKSLIAQLHPPVL